GGAGPGTGSPSAWAASSRGGAGRRWGRWGCPSPRRIDAPRTGAGRAPARIASPMAKKKDGGERFRDIAQNRKAFHDYEILERVEAGLVLQGSEVKGLRDRGANIRE